MGRTLPEQYRVLASPSRIELLYALQTRGSQSIEQLAEICDLHTNTTREHLHRLIDAGFVRSESIRRASRGRPRMLYSIADTLADSATAQRVRDAYERADLVRSIVAPKSVSPQPSTSDRQLDVLEDQLDTCGFDATVERDDDPDATRITVHHCPYYDLAGRHPHVCDVHFGMLGTALTLTDGPLEASDLHARDPEKGCWVTLTRREHARRIA
ncbi:helix-turn-helix transcriptional regulator [Paramicrobacterium fandaimingii]|uniref:helix-turn-helix transcriptional regulator n=1 Tax=Paramicrobacterium fandaimingii TaxID=2708079 RepID=UPI0014225F3B|nr:helix-turn-helix domain-containing protein [Microbacterium fandaimingii]